VADENTLEWALHIGVGDTIDYRDERGVVFKLRIVGSLANSILQGSLLIDEKRFLERFPSETGYRMFLVDAPSKESNRVEKTLTRAMQDAGLALTPATGRLAAYNAVENTYLDTFQMLGGLGLLLGSAGLGVVVLRNALERRRELAALQAIGYNAGNLRWMMFSEHGALLALGLAIGTVSALVAVLPAIASPGANIPYLSLSLTLLAIFASGLAWTQAACWLATRGPLMAALREN
jgi:ABC-type antimicrobial peptide transport system permease subunit